VTYAQIPAGTLNWDVPVNAAFTDQDTRIAANTTNIATNTSQIAGKASKSGDTFTGDVTINTNLTVNTNATVNGYLACNAGQSSGQWNVFSGAKDGLNFGTLGGGIQIKSGTNARMGVATLAAGTVTVTNNSVTANTRIFLSRETTGGTVGHLSSTRSNGVSFTINSSSGTDTSTVAWLLIEQS